MDPTALFFSKFRKLAVTLEAGTEKLQRSFENRSDVDDSERVVRAADAYRELDGDVRSLKWQVEDAMKLQKAQEIEVNSFIKACKVIELKVVEDLKILKGHWEKYGYQGPTDKQGLNKVRGCASEEEADTLDENRIMNGGQDSCQVETPPLKMSPLPTIDLMRTPQLTDFGLSEMELKRNFAGIKRCLEVPPAPQMILPHHTLSTPATPPMTFTPKRALRMDDDDLQTPQMHNFGISESTVWLNNDFTIDLFKKNIEKPQRLIQSPTEPQFNSPIRSIEKEGEDDLESFCHSTNLGSTPEVPEFQAPYMKSLVSAKKSEQLKTEEMKAENGHMTDLTALDLNEGKGSSPTLEYHTLELSILDSENKQLPEMPNLESILGKSLQTIVSHTQSKKFVNSELQHIIPENRFWTLSQVSQSEFQSLPGYLRQMTLNSLNQAVSNINKYLECHVERREFQIEELRKITNIGTKAPMYILCLSELKRLELVERPGNTAVYKLNMHS